MKKILFLSIIVGLVLGVSSCKRSEIDDPDWNGPSSFNILLEGSVSPALLLIDGRIHSSQIVVRVTDAAGNPLVNRTVFFEQLPDQYSQKQLDWGYFPNNQSVYQRNTDANGMVSVTFYWPTQYYSEEMWIHALLVVDGRAYKDTNIPQDYIRLTMYRTGDAASGTAK